MGGRYIEWSLKYKTWDWRKRLPRRERKHNVKWGNDYNRGDGSDAAIVTLSYVFSTVKYSLIWPKHFFLHIYNASYIGLLFLKKHNVKMR